MNLILNLKCKNHFNERITQNFILSNFMKYPIWFIKDGKVVNANSLVGILSLSLKKDDVIDILTCVDFNNLQFIDDYLWGGELLNAEENFQEDYNES